MAAVIAQAHRSNPRWPTLLSLYFAALIATLAFVSLIGLLRRLSGNLVVPLEFSAAFMAGILISAGSWWLRRAAQALSLFGRIRPVWLVAVTAITWIILATMTGSGMSNLAVLAMWLPVAAMEAAWQVLPHAARAPQTLLSPNRNLQEHAAENVVQQFSRLRENGVETIEGVARMEFLPHEQTAVVHLAFCPPLAVDPQLSVELVEPAEVLVRATEARTYGVRIEGKRTRSAVAALSILLHVKSIG
jgi:hypothetical protein